MKWVEQPIYLSQNALRIVFLLVDLHVLHNAAFDIEHQVVNFSHAGLQH